MVKNITHRKLPDKGRLICGPIPPPPFEESLATLRRAGVCVIACLLEDAELPVDLVERYREEGLAVIRFPIPDFCAPEDEVAFGAFVKDLVNRLARGEGIYLHCYGGVGRTGTVLACLLKAGGLRGDPVSTVRRIYSSGALESEEQRQFARGFRLV